MTIGTSRRNLIRLGLGIALATLITAPTLGIAQASAATGNLAVSNMTASLVKSNGASAGLAPYTNNQIAKIVVKFQIKATGGASVDISTVHLSLSVSNQMTILGTPLFFTPADACKGLPKSGKKLTSVLNCTYAITFQPFYLSNDSLSVGLSATGCAVGSVAPGCLAEGAGYFLASATRNVPLIGFSFAKKAVRASATAVNYGFTFTYSGLPRSVKLNDPQLQSIWGANWRSNLNCSVKSSSTSVTFDSNGQLPLAPGDVVTCITNQSIDVTSAQAKKAPGWTSNKSRNTCTLTNTATATVDTSGTNSTSVAKWPGKGTQTRTTSPMTSSCKK